MKVATERVTQNNMDLILMLTIFVSLIFVTNILVWQQLSLISSIDVRAHSIEPSTTDQLPISINAIVSTRGHFNYSTSDELISNHNSTDYQYRNIVTGDNEILCPPENELVIYIHGAWTDKQAANEQFDRTAMSLVSNNYSLPFVGFSWDSNTPINNDGWEIAKNIADKNGPKLAQFILDFKSKCRDTDIRIIAHSLGGEVVNSTLASLSSNQQWDKKGGFNITSVHLLGAAIDRSSVAANSTFGKAIERLVGGFYNLRNSEDNMLQYVYQNIEKHDALGLLGISHGTPMPRNYFEREVNSEIPPIQDVDGNSKLDCFDYFVLLPGDNHCGYIGARGLPPLEDIPRNDGAIDIVVQDWLDR